MKSNYKTLILLLVTVILNIVAVLGQLENIPSAYGKSLGIDDNENTLDNEDSLIHSFESVMRFKLHVHDVGSFHLPCVESPEFEQHYVTWKFKVCPKSIGSDGSFDASLVSVFGGDTEAWSCEAEASFKLLPKNGQNPYERSFGYFNFSAETPSRDLKSFVRIKDLVENYAINGVATIDIRIMTKPPNRIPKQDRTSTKFTMVVKELSKLKNQYSSEVVVRGIRWKVLATKQNEFFAVFVYANEDDMDTDWSWIVSADFQVISSGKDQPISKRFSGVKFDWTNSNWGYPNFIKWSELFDSNKKYVVNDAILLQIELNVEKPKAIF